MSALPPGPRSPSIVQALRFGRDPTGFLLACAQRFGDTFTLRLPSDLPKVVLAHPDDIQRVFSMRPEHYRSNELSLHLNVGERSVLFADGERHRRKRTLITPVLQASRVRRYAQTMAEAARAELDAWPHGQPLPLYPRLRDITLDVILRCVFGAEGDQWDALRDRTLTWLEGALSPGMFLAGTIINPLRMRALLERGVQRERRDARALLFRRICRAKADAVGILHKKIQARRREEPGTHDDVLSVLAAARYDDGTAMSDEDILDQLITLLVGGHETTAQAMAWAVSLICRRPAVVGRIRQELVEVFGDGQLDPARARELRYLDACIKESMRLHPISPGPTRKLAAELPLRRYRLPAGIKVWPSIYLAQRHAERWDRPAAFMPERFLGASAPSKFEFFPFGGGSHRCLGAVFAGFEMRIVLAELFRRFDVRPAAPPPRTAFAGISMAPSDELPITVQPAAG